MLPTAAMASAQPAIVKIRRVDALIAIAARLCASLAALLLLVDERADTKYTAIARPRVRHAMPPRVSLLLAAAAARSPLRSRAFAFLPSRVCHAAVARSPRCRAFATPPSRVHHAAVARLPLR